MRESSYILFIAFIFIIFNISEGSVQNIGGWETTLLTSIIKIIKQVILSAMGLRGFGAEIDPFGEPVHSLRNTCFHLQF